MEILDTSSIINSRAIPQGAHFITSPGVVGELKDKWSHFRVTALLASDKITVVFPKDEHIQEIISSFRKLGSDLSDVDVEVLALALQFKGGVVVTDDLEMQNVAKFLRIKYRPATNHQISIQLRWIAICTGCNRQFSDLESFDHMTCDHCGSPLKKRARKIRRKSSNSKHKEDNKEF